MKKGTLVAIGVFAALLILVLATRERQVSEGITKLELPGVEKGSISGLEISGAQSATLRKEGDTWEVFDPAHPDAKYPADAEQVRSALDSLPELKNADLVTERAEKHADLEVDDAHGRKVRLLNGSSAVAELIFGKVARGGTYVRKAGSNTVFSTTSRLGWMARWEVNSWRKRDFVGVKLEDVAQVTVRIAGAEPYTLKAGDGGTWTLAEPAQPPASLRFDAQAAQWMVQQLTSLSAQDFAQGLSDESSGLAGPHDVIEAKLKDGKTLTLHLGTALAAGGQDSKASGSAPPKPSLVPVRKEGDAQIYLVPASTAQGVRKKLTDLRDLSLLSIDPQKVTQVSIQAGGKKTVAIKDGASWKIIEPKKLPDGFEFDPNRVDAQLSGLRGVHAARWVEPAVSDSDSGLSKPSAVVELTLEGGATQSLRFGKEVPSTTGAQELFVKGSADSGLYVIAQAERTRFEAGVELFKKKPAPPGGTAAVQGLDSLPPELRKQIEEQLRNARPHP
ncbi:DUF4340 domain-containing protein [Hyalangium versicolor]|uniref:DUF4340 domain-containing protein n=1 Tax=Hyalangium versicolor TaxID=2861190 RepID=UPI001CCCD9AE|nr:DUF4340 domain-containing protein [Hyalangium versicolor]